MHVPLREPLPESLRMALRDLIRRLGEGEEIVNYVDDEPLREPEEDTDGE